jgi:tetratricopeptide (TPR) repeat protein
MSRCCALVLAFAIASSASPAFAQSAGAPAPDSSSPPASEQPPAADPSAAAKDEARKRFDQGLSLFEDGDFRLALIEFERAYAVVPDYRVLYNIAQVNIQLGRYAKARSVLEEYVEKAGDALPESRAAGVKDDLKMLAARTAHLNITSTPPGAEIILNDTIVGTTPLASPLLVDAGEQRVELRKQGYVSRTQQVKLAGGDEGSVSVTLVAEEKARTVIVERDKPIVREERPSWLWASWTATGVLAAGAVATGVFGISKVNEYEDEKDLPQTDKEKLQDLSSEADTLLLAADIAGAAALVAGGVSLYFTLNPKKVTEAPKPLEPKLSARGTPNNFRILLTSEF